MKTELTYGDLDILEFCLVETIDRLRDERRQELQDYAEVLDETNDAFLERVKEVKRKIVKMMED